MQNRGTVSDWISRAMDAEAEAGKWKQIAIAVGPICFLLGLVAGNVLI